MTSHSPEAFNSMSTLFICLSTFQTHCNFVWRENCQAIFAAWTSLSPMIGSTSVDESVVAAFDTVYSLIQSQDRKRLNLRFAYFPLNSAINALDTVGEVAYTNTYLNARNNSSDISSDQLTEYASRSKRWSTLADPSPFLLSVYIRSDETIVYVLPAFLQFLQY